MPRGAVSVCSILSPPTKWRGARVDDLEYRARHSSSTAPSCARILSRTACLQRLKRRTKARERRASEARPDLAYARFAVRNPRTEDRLDALRDDLTRVDAEGRAAER